MNAVTNYPTVDEVYEAIKSSAPTKYVVNYEYPGYVSIWSDSWSSDEMEVAVGTANICFGWSNAIGDGDEFEGVTDVNEIVRLVLAAVEKVGE